MKRIHFKLLLLGLLTMTISCEDEYPVFDANGGQTALSFEQTSFDVIVPEEDRTLNIPVFSTTRSNTERNYEVVINNEDTTEGTENEYSIGQIVIPAGEFSGNLSVDFDFSEIAGEDGEQKQLTFSIIPGSGENSYNDVVTINYFREIVCNDMELTIVSDIYASETGFRIERADGTIVVDDFFPFSGDALTPQTYTANFFLEDGDYVFTLLDTFGDGQQGSAQGVTLTGSYELRCSIIVHASGEGELENGTFESTAFSVNP